MARHDLMEIKDLLRGRIEDLCRTLLPRGRRDGRLWVSSNPVTGDDRQEPAFKVAMDRDTGAWIDWRSGEKGDVIGLISYLNGTDVKGALAWARDWLGLARMNDADRAAMRRRVAETRADDEARQRADAERRAHAVARLWREAVPLGNGSPAEAHVRGYFRGRACPLEDVETLDRDSFRVTPALEWWKGAEWRHENGRRVKARPGPSFPALVSAFRAPTGQVTGVHCTFLDPLRPQKAAVSPAKLMFGDVLGAVIRISHGPEGWPPETARARHPLILCEGVEDGVSLALSIPEARVWAAGSLTGMGGAPVDMDCIGEIFIAADNDWQSPQAMNQFDLVFDRICERAGNRSVAVMRSPLGKDFNDALMGKD